MRSCVAVALVCALAPGCDWVFRLDKVEYKGSDAAGPDADLVNGPWKLVSAGDGWTCGITMNDQLYCWGQNQGGQLGLGDQTFRLTPTLVGDGFRDVELGIGHACGLKMDGSLWCWGDNGHGQLGDTTTNDSASPVRAGTATYESVDVGDEVSCAIRANDKALECWGDNYAGQLGNGSTNESHTPTPVQGGGMWSQVSTSSTHVCGVKMDGTGYCWGTDYSGELGGGVIGNQSTPHSISGGHTWKQISAGFESSCGIDSMDRVFCWGDNSTGVLGDGASNNDHDTPFGVTATGAFSQVETADTHACAVGTDNSMWCWGDAASSPLDDLKLIPTQVSDPGTVDKIALGRTHTCRHAPGNAIACIGDGSAGQLGDGVLGPTLVPQLVTHPTGHVWKTVDGGENNTCAIDDADDVYCWGQGLYGANGDGTRKRRLTPVKVATGTSWSDLSVGDDHACATNPSGVSCWGANPGGSIGAPPNSSTAPIVIGNLTTASAGRHTCAISGTSVRCWGSNDHGQIGNNMLGTPALTPTQPMDGNKIWSYISVSYDHTCGIAENNVHCWGSNRRGELGIANMGVDYPTPQALNPAIAAVAIFAGPNRTCLRTSFYVKCWGANFYDSLGTAATTTPTDIANAADWASVTLGDYHTCGPFSDGTAHCFGRNQFGQLGDGTQTQSAVPVALGTDHYGSLSAGADHTCGVRKPSGELYCWGSNRDGALGTGGGWTNNWTVPVAPP